MNPFLQFFKNFGVKNPFQRENKEALPPAGGEGPEHIAPAGEESAPAPGPSPEERKARRAALLHKLGVIFTGVGLAALTVTALVLILLSSRARRTETQAEGPTPAPTAQPGPINFCAPVDPERLRSEGPVTYVGDELIAVSAPGRSYTEMERFFGERGLRIVGYVELTDTYQLRLPEELGLEGLNRAAAELMQADEVDRAAVNAVWQPACQSAPEDPWGGRADWEAAGPNENNWGLMAIHAPAFWAAYPPDEVRLGVVDLGFDENQEDLDYALLRNNESFTRQGDFGQPGARGHGTHAASVAGAIHGNGLGLSGTAANCRIFGFATGGWCGSMQLLSAAAAFAEQDARVILVGLGYGEELQTLAMEGDGDVRRYYFDEAAATASLAMGRMLGRGYDFLLVQSAGNGVAGEGVDARWNSALCYAQEPELAGRVLVVGAAGLRAGGELYQPRFSNTGERVDVLAPGVQVYGAEPGGYALRDGSSCAAAQTAGMCAAIWTAAPELSGPELRNLVIQTADAPVTDGAAPLINMEAALKAARP